MKNGVIMRRIRIVLMTLFMLTCFATAAAAEMADCTIKMIYKEKGKLPLIAKKPDDSGAYLELFSKAAEDIGCKLTVSRSSKKRLHQSLEKGEVDFYPGASYSAKRSKYLHYVPNGFQTGEYGITSLEFPEIQDYQQVKELGMLWLMELGSSKTDIANRIGIETQSVNSADIEKARLLIEKGRKTFYVADKELVDFYLKTKGLKNFKEANLKVHYECCGGNNPMYMAFSRFSNHIKEIPNPNYDPSKKLSPRNAPKILDPNSVAAKLGKALEKLMKSGETEKIYQKYFSK